MKYLRIIIIIVFIFSSYLYSLDTIALTIKVKGTVELNRDSNIKEIITGEELYNNDILESKKDSFAAIKFIDGSSIVKLFPNSILEIRIEKEDKQLNKNNFLKMGELWAKVTQYTGKFEVETPTTVVSVKGTTFLLSIDKNGETDLFTFSGEVLIKNKVDGESALVGEGEKAHSSGSGPIEVLDFNITDLDEEIKEYIEEISNVLEIHLENPDGEKKEIIIEFE